VDVFVAGVGTGGTITGVGEVVKKRKPSVMVVAVEPVGAAVLSGRTPGTHQMPGIGVGFVPEVLNRSILDEVICVTDDCDGAISLDPLPATVEGTTSNATLDEGLEPIPKPIRMNMHGIETHGRAAQLAGGTDSRQSQEPAGWPALCEQTQGHSRHLLDLG
jgi:hypothetical protein